ncbi:hypothetical protein KQI76_08970 [Amphibacillus sp. MSJ-3]|uniref:hypothetical protein n=1 Tax=Amphibacillus sp. MSJ-3 TaxID=2841505 RepID=UPI001C0E9202|nr:hypothetical protein [Amphibacillus sp. MSJ-3]MBU5595284.1 hypothetical protein [Amphibacillus sp. MSJ-3]
MFLRIYQQLLILGFSEKTIFLAGFSIGFFCVFLIIRPIIYYLISKRCYTLLSYLFTLLLILLLINEWLTDLRDLNLNLYLYFFSLVTGLLSVRLIYKKIVRKHV